MTSLPRPTRRPRPRLVDRLPERDPEPERYNTASSIAALLAEPAQPVAPPKPAPKAQPVDPYATQVIDPDAVARAYRWIVWVGLAISFGCSIIGNIRPFGGDATQLFIGAWPNRAYLSSAPFGVALLCAFVYQFIVQVFQFHFKQQAWTRRYWVMVAVSVLPSLWTFAPLIERVNASTQIGYVWLYLITTGVLGLNDYMQEKALQKRKRG